MTKRSNVEERSELLQGTLDFVVLQTLRWKPQHGYGIAQMIRTQTRDVLQVETGALYPALHRLERKKWIDSEWQLSEHRQRVKVYQLTAAGKKRLHVERAKFARFSEALARLGDPRPAES